MNRKLLLLGAGGHCRSCIDVIEAEGIYEISGILQPKNGPYEEVLGHPIIGCDDDLPSILHEIPSALITVGQIKDPCRRINLYNLLKKYRANIPVIKSPFSYCSPRAQLGEGTILLHGSYINTNAEIGANCIINSMALIEHDVKVHNHCHISTGVRINGNVVIGQGSFIGSGCVIREGVQIGDRVVVSAGKLVMQDIQSGEIVRNQF